MSGWQKTIQVATLIVCLAILLFIILNFQLDHSFYSTLVEVKQGVHQLVAASVHSELPSATSPTNENPATPKRNPTLTLTPAPTPAPTPTLTPKTALSTASLSTLLFKDDFSNPNSGWTIARSSTSGYESSYDNGELRISKQNSNAGYMNSELQRLKPVSDFVVEVDARQISFAADGYYGLLFRQEWITNKVKWYGFWINSTTGEYWIEKNVESRRYNITTPTYSSHIKTGSNSNHLRVVAVGSTIEVYVNGQFLRAITDSTFSKGTFGLAVAGVDNSVKFDNFTVFSSPQFTYVDDFSNVDSGWTKQSRNPTRLDDGYVITSQQSYFYILVKESNAHWFVRNTRMGEYSDFICQVDGSIETEQVYGWYGLCFRSSLDISNYYTFWVSPLGEYAIQNVVNGGTQYLVPWTDSPFIIKGSKQVNRLMVECRGTEIRIYVNGQFLTAVTDSSHGSGFVFLAVSTFERSNVRFIFDDFKFSDTSSQVKTPVPTPMPAPIPAPAPIPSPVPAPQPSAPTSPTPTPPPTTSSTKGDTIN